MNEVTPRSIRRHADGYCSQIRTPLSSFRTIEEGVKIIEELLKKNVLCRHDVKDINQVYRAMDLLERQIDQIPACNSQHALKKIIEKVEKIARYKNISAGGLISLYHLQNFSDKELHINECFNSLLSKFEKKPEEIKDIATHLPYCYSETQFNEDVTSLIGSNQSDNNNQSDEVTKILNRKKEKLQSHEHTKQAIENKKAELKERRNSDPQNYPPYFDELLDNGYIYLYDHLIHMRALLSRNERRSEIEKMTFSLLSHVVLETREAVIRKVESSIPANHHNILFLLGGSGAGKSTTLCFLRGDTMVLKDFHYISQSRKSGLIGHEGATSCTFLPTIEVVNDLVIVDFSGFDDTNGQVISLGMEFALKALIKQYHPKILVLEAITNTEGRFAAAAQLGLRLRRLLANKENCILGITKYSKDPDFGQIKAIEEQQKKERLAPTQEEIGLMGQIEALSALNMANLLPIIQEKQQQLAKIQQEKAQKLQLPLHETDPKAESRRRIQEKENEILKQIGLGSVIRFYDLEDSSHLSKCLTTLSQLSEKESISVNPEQLLEPDDEKLLEDRFKNSLTKEIEAKENYDVKVADFKAFEQSVLESSLIKTIFSHSNPEIGQFLHLPEIDPTIVREYDRKIVSTCIKEYMRAVIRTLNISLINKILNEMGVKAPKAKVVDLNKKLIRLRNYVMGLVLPVPEDPQQAEKEWDRIQREYEEAAINAIKENPTWLALAAKCLTVIGSISLYSTVVTSGICALLEWNIQKKATQKMIESTIDTCCNDLDEIYDVLLRLKHIEKTIEKQEAIDQVLKSVQISMESLNALKVSIQNRINKVRNVYGNEDWDKRVSFLADKFLLNISNNKKIIPVDAILALTYGLIEPNRSIYTNITTTAEGGSKWSLIVGKNLNNDIADNFFNISLTTPQVKLEHEIIGVLGIGHMSHFLRRFDFERFGHKNSPLMRMLSAAVMLKAHEKTL